MSLASVWNKILSFTRETQMADEIELHLDLLQDPFGDAGPHEFAGRAERYLLDHATEAHPRLLELLETDRASNPPAVIDLLPRFGLPESIPVLEKILTQGLDSLSGTAATALARHPAGEAFQALVRGLAGTAPEVVKASADGLAIRGDRAACPRLRDRLDHPDSEIRYHVIQSAARLGCLDPGELAAIAETDRDADIRHLAQRILEEHEAGPPSERV